MIGCLRTRVHKHPIIVLYFEFYNLEAGVQSSGLPVNVSSETTSPNLTNSEIEIS